MEELEISNENIEAQWLYLHKEKCKDVVVCNAYRPPGGDLKKAVGYLEDSLKIFNLGKVDFFLLGDLNINYINKKSPDYKRLNFFVKSNGFTQHINSTTRNTDKTKSLLDLAITNSKFISHAGTLEHFISDHQPIYVIHKKGRDTRPSVKFEGRSYRNFNINKFKEMLTGMDWGYVFDLTDPNEAWEYILKNITTVLDVMCPVRSFHIKNYRPDWMTKELIEQVKDRDYFYKKAKLQGDEDAWNVAKYLRNRTNANIRQAKREFILDELKAHDDNPKKFWKVIRKVVPTGKSDQSNDIMLKHNGKKIDKDQVAQYINDYFINVGKISTPYSQKAHDPTAAPIIDPGEIEGPLFAELGTVTEREVYKVVQEINISKSSGLENVSSFILKEAFKTLISEVTFMFNLSIKKSKFPNVWKQALVVPIPKTGNLTLVKNYRPISLLPLPGKILEKLVHQQLSTYLETESLLSDKQHGFRKKHSTVHSVAQLSNYISKKMDTRTPTLVAYVDFKKAFDCVQHSVLLAKLASLGVGRSIVNWVESYLSNREQRVFANNCVSPSKKITQGVPQGSVLGPLFYIIYANDLIKTVSNCEVALYADDTVLFTADNNFDISICNLQGDLNALSAWCHDNGIMANTDKTKVMVFGSPNVLGKVPSFDVKLDGASLQRVSLYKYLGVTLDTGLTYSQHVSKTISSVTSKLKQFQRMRSFLNSKAALMVYKNMMLPILEYGDVFFSATTCLNRKRLQVLQNKGLRCALNKGIEVSTIELHSEAKLLQLKYRREQHLLNFMYDQVQNHSLLKAKSSYGVQTRSCNKLSLKVKRPYTEKFKKSLSYKGPKKWNMLPESFHHAPGKQAFKLMVENLVKNKSVKANLNESCLES